MSDEKHNKDELDGTEMNELVSAEEKASEVEAASGESEASVSDDVQQPDGSDTSTDAETDGENPEGADDEFSADDLLDEVRRTLIEDTTEEEASHKGSWWKRLGGRKKDKEVEAPFPELVQEVEEESGQEVAASVEDASEYSEQIDELIDMLEDEESEVEEAKSLEPVKPAQVVVEEPVVEKPKVDFNEMKRRAFAPSAVAENENFSEVRSVALDGEDDVFIEVESTPVDSTAERMKAIENAFLPYRQYIYFLILFLAGVAAVMTIFYAYGAYKRSLPPPIVEEVENLPYPIKMDLPGGVSFDVTKGMLENGKWEPKSAEWLVGTEICRWIAIPYSMQLEAVVRTLTRKDSIELTMSNNDVLTYNVNAIQQMSIEEMQKLDAGSPCLLLVLAQPGEDSRWVVTAIP